MKLWKRGVCCCLAFAIVLAGLPLAILSATQTTDKRYVIFDANPRNVSETDGANAYPSGADYSWSFGKDRICGTSSIKYEGEETPCYVLDFDSAFDHDKVLIENGFMCNNGGSNATPGKISSGYMGWLQYPEILRAIKDYVYVSYDVYVEDAQERDITLTVSPMHQYMDPWAKNPQSNCGVFDRFTVTEKNEWISRSVKINSIADAAATADKWTQGDVFFQVSGLGNAALTVKIRNFRLEIKESNHENINTALSEVANIDKKKNFTTYSWSENDPLPDLPKTSGGKNDYFAILAAFDWGSEYSSNIVTSSIVNACEDPNGSVLLSKTYEKSGNMVSVTVAPNDGYKLEKLTVKDADGNNVAAKRTGINTFDFIMPTSKVTVSAVFTEDDNTDDINYVIWDANADRFIGKNDIIYTNPSESYLWFNKQTVGTVTAVDDDKSYYKIVLNKNGAVNGNGEGGTAVIKSGAGSFSGIPWLSDINMTKALLPYLAMSFEARRTDSSDAKPQYKVGMAPVWAEYGDAQFGIIDKDDPLNSDRNNWHTYTFSNLDPDTADNVCDEIFGHWADGLFRIGAESDNAADQPSNENPVTVDIRGMSLVLRESYRLEINQYLADSGYTPNGSYDWNTACESVGEDANGNKDYFALLAAFDAQSAYSSNYSDHTVTNGTEPCEGGSITLSKRIAKPNMQIAVNLNIADGYRLSQIFIVKSDGSRTAVDDVRGDKAYFNMPDDDITVTASFVKKSDKMQVLFQAEPIAAEHMETPPVFSGETEIVSADGKCAAWKFTFDENIGNITVYGNSNRLYTDISNDSELTFFAKSDSAAERKLEILSSDGSAIKTVTLSNKWSFYRVQVSSLLEKAPDRITFRLKDASKDDVVYISECEIWSKSTAQKNFTELFEEVWDISDYTMGESHKQIGIIGDPDGDVSPWEEIYDENEKSKVGWSLAWFEQFKGESPWFIGFKTENFGDEYSLGFYHNKDHTLAQDDMSEWMETGYLEFYIKSETDGLCIPFNVESMGNSRRNIPLKVVYHADKARPDGYMKVQIPLSYLYAMGLDLSKIQYIQIRGIQEVNDDIYLSAFRFYSNLAPDEPDPVVEPEETVIYSFQIDEKLFKGTVDHKNLTLTVPYGTYLWELLAGLKFDALDMSVMVKDADGRSQTEDVILTADMTLTLMQDGYIVDEYKIVIIGEPYDNPLNVSQEGNTNLSNNKNLNSNSDGNSADDETETQTVIIKKKRLVKKPGTSAEEDFNFVPIVIAVCTVVAVAAVILVILVINKKKKNQNRSGLK